MTDLFEPPQIYNIPLSKGRDLYCEFAYEELVVDNDGNPVLDAQGNEQYESADYPTGSTVQLVLEATTVVTGTAVIVDDLATVLIDHLEVDVITKSVLWRLEITYADGIDDVLANGTTYRSDGLEAV